ncbi:MAG TPA: class II fructose-bisphosphate aldolase [Bacillota bacterium]|nr:class II fructose-bisphosphate aldolase [Bacillota bacterium]HOL09144.1 class II fructose-bisphosphate aldolase [Bacillota bacterium]HPO96818.1 class II fructose-bisphosphate aldolase [Bacillota bacterium]
MSIGNILEIVRNARKHGRAVGAFEINGLEEGLGIYDAVVATNQPVILQVNNQNVGAAFYQFYAGLARLVAELCPVPVGVQLTYCSNFEDAVSAINAGFLSLMVDCTKSAWEDNIKLVTEIVKYAHRKDVTVEVLLDSISVPEEPMINETDERYLDRLLQFVLDTKIDLLAFLLNTTTKMDEPQVNYLKLQQLQETMPVPLVLVERAQLKPVVAKQCIKLGIAKVNFMDSLLEEYLNQVFVYYQNDHQIASLPQELLKIGRSRVAELVNQKLILLS